MNWCLNWYGIVVLKWYDKITNMEITKRTKQNPFNEEVGKRHWRWIGHALRKTCQ